jgi:hypothetical protein
MIKREFGEILLSFFVGFLPDLSWFQQLIGVEDEDSCG